MGRLLRFSPFALVAAAVWFLLGPGADEPASQAKPAAEGVAPRVGDEVKEYAVNEAASAAMRVASALEMFRCSARYIASLPEVATLEPKSVLSALQAQSHTHQEIAATYLFDLTGELIESWPKGRQPIAAWRWQAAQAVRTGEISWGGPVQGPKGPVLLLAAPVIRIGAAVSGADGSVRIPTTTVGALGVESAWDRALSVGTAGGGRVEFILLGPHWRA